MPHRASSPLGAPTWADLWTSDTSQAIAFYGELLGWEAEEPNPDFGGYFNFTRKGERIAGCMGDMGPDMRADNTWKCYFTADDAARGAALVTANGGTVRSGPHPVGDLGIQVVWEDPAGAVAGTWQPGTFPGFTTLAEPGAPGWFELHTAGYVEALEFYASVLGWDVRTISDSSEFRYSVGIDPASGEELCGILDASGWQSAGEAQWYLYWDVADADRAAATVSANGGTVIEEPGDTPYGRIANVADTTGTNFRIRQAPA